MDGLIGHTGFVGTNLIQQHVFNACFNTANINQLAGAHFDTLICAAASGSMFEANRFPERDAERISNLISQLDTVGSARRFVLISTVAVLDSFKAENEKTAAFEAATPYGVNRRKLEVFVAQRFPGALIIRLPALFGTGLKKNFLFDLLNPMPSMVPPAGLIQIEDATRVDLKSFYPFDEGLGMHVLDRDAFNHDASRAQLERDVSNEGLSALRFTNPASQFQFYDMRSLWRDIQRGLDHGLGTLHLAPEPISASNVHQAITGDAMSNNNARMHSEDMRTSHGALWGQFGPYIAEKSEILQQLKSFVAACRISA